MKLEEKTKKSNGAEAGTIRALRKKVKENIADQQQRIDDLQDHQRIQEKILADLADPRVRISYEVVLTDTDSYQTGDPFPQVEVSRDDLAEAVIAAVRRWQRNSGWKLETILGSALEKRSDPWPSWRVTAIIDGRSIRVPDKVWKLLIRTLDFG